MMKSKIFILFFLVSLNCLGQKQFEVFFDFNKDFPNQSSILTLNEWIANNKDIEITKLLGFCDSIDTRDYNKHLAQRRIESVRELLEKYLPKPWEKFVNEAQAFIMAGDFTAALPLLRQAYEDSKHNAAIACLIAQCHLELNRIDNAEAILATIKMADQDAHYEQLLEQVALKKQAAKTPELIALEASYSDEPDNLQIAYQLAVQYYADAVHRPALELLINIIRKDRNFAEGAAKKTLMDILAALGKGDPLAIEFQRKLFTLLY